MQKRWVLAVFAALVLTLAFAGTALAAEPGTVISNELSGTITVQGATVEATWVETGRYGTNGGNVYKEYKLMYGGNQISLASGNVTSITVVEPGNVTKTLTANTDSTLWFNVVKPSGDYVFTIVTADNTSYTATLKWTKMNILDIGWDLSSPATKTVNREFTINSTAKLNSALTGVTEVSRVLYVIEVTKDNAAVGTDDVTVVASDGQALGYDEIGKFFYWGPRTGFTFSTSMYGEGNNVTTPFKVTFKNTGTYNVKAYAVQLPVAA